MRRSLLQLFRTGNRTRHVCSSTCSMAVKHVSSKRVLLQNNLPLSNILVNNRYFSDDVKDKSENNDTKDKDKLVLVEKLDNLHIMTIGINRPDKRNAVNTDTAEQLKLAFQDFEADEEMHIAVLHGLGGNFCAGYDLEVWDFILQNKWGKHTHK